MSSLDLQPKIIFIFPYRFREFDRKRFEIECLKENFQVVIFELIDALHPQFSGAFHTRDQGCDILRYSTIAAWEEKFREIVGTSRIKPYVVNFVPVTTFGELRINYVLSSLELFIIEYNNPGVPQSLKNDSLMSNLRTKLKFATKRGTFVFFKKKIISRFVRYLSLLIVRDSDYVLTAGEVNKKYNSAKEINANSFDYTMFLKMRNKTKETPEYGSKPVIVYIDTGAPFFKTDNTLTGNKHPITVDNWYPALRSFFEKIEDFSGLKVMVAAHPKHMYSQTDSRQIFGDREVVHGETVRVIQEAEIVLTTNSTAVSYAVLFNKPVIILNSDEIVRDDNVLNNDALLWSKELNCSLVNIDRCLPEPDFENMLRADEGAYASYIRKYLTSRGDFKTNCEVINEIINDG